MIKIDQKDKNNFICPRSRYYGGIKLENLMFNANLQEFAHKVSFIANLETGGKLSPEQAYEQIQTLWKKLEHSKEELKIGMNNIN
ncbi:hypothetical protein I8748_29305 [Nostoc sp. CENA67]|uniref:Isopropylmalate/homocitrate/citramalate synthases n=1 Tax=Amazonocrinis nigriterrae CENA67 TaxID=2794033 RepID=A0A8J7HZF4_9NOST|nr:hypothetical protein [Amazonocrinis nigriterrae]MBH8566208.1 hypothetical protein [Amazonocrinis nigriterrae CENA67]